MTTNSNFESRTGKLTCSSEVFFNFITDIRNFRQFIPAGSIENWNANIDNCTFHLPPLGSADIRISDKTPYSKVVYSGNVLQDNKFALSVQVSDNQDNKTGVKLFLTAEMNPVLKIMATGPIEQFLEKLISEMEKFEKWDERFKEN